MSTFYKYAERNVANRVDWSVIGKDISDMLKTENELREKKKSDIEKATQETLKTLADAPTGLDRGVNENILNLSSQSQDYMLMMNRLLKSGQLDPKDYSIYTQNLKTDTQKLFTTTKQYQEAYAKGIERAKTGVSSSQEVYLRSLVENAANFSKSQFYINNNGRLTVGMPELDPATGQYVLNKDPNTYKTIDMLRYASTIELDKFDVDKEVKNVVDSFGKEIKSDPTLKNQVIKTISDITSRKGYAEAEMNYIRGLLVNPNSSSSILSDWIKSKDGKVYEYTTNPEDPRLKTHEAILMVPDPANPTSGVLTPKLDPEQMKEAETFLRERIRAGLDKEMQTQYYKPDQPQEWQARRGDEKKDKETALNAWGKLFTGATPAEKNAAKQQLLGTDRALSSGLVDIDFTSTPGSIVFKYSGGRPNRVVPFDANTNTLMDWNMIGTEIHGVEDVANVMKRSGGGNPNARMNASQRNFQGIGGGREEKKDAGAVFTEHINAIPSNIFEKKDAAAANELAKYLKNSGVTIKPNAKANLFNEVTLTYGKNSITLKANESEEDAVTQAENLRSWLEQNVPATVKQSLVDKGIIGATPQANTQNTTVTGGNVR